MSRTNTYADLRPSRALCLAFSEVMKDVTPEATWKVSEKPEPGAYSTDQGTFADPQTKVELTSFR